MLVAPSSRNCGVPIAESTTPACTSHVAAEADLVAGQAEAMQGPVSPHANLSCVNLKTTFKLDCDNMPFAWTLVYLSN